VFGWVSRFLEFEVYSRGGEVPRRVGSYMEVYVYMYMCTVGTSGNDGLVLSSLRRFRWNGFSRDFTRCVLASLVTNGGFFLVHFLCTSMVSCLQEKVTCEM
jgi:hypothetical protein